MLVNSFDTKYSQTAKVYESLDNTFVKILENFLLELRILEKVISKLSYFVAV